MSGYWSQDNKIPPPVRRPSQVNQTAAKREDGKRQDPEDVVETSNKKGSGRFSGLVSGLASSLVSGLRAPAASQPSDERAKRLAALPEQLNAPATFRSFLKLVEEYLLDVQPAMPSSKGDDRTAVLAYYRVQEDGYVGDNACIQACQALADLLKDKKLSVTFYTKMDSPTPGDGHAFIGLLIKPDCSARIKDDNVLIIDGTWKQYLPDARKKDYSRLPNIFVGVYSELKEIIAAETGENTPKYDEMLERYEAATPARSREAAVQQFEG